jgi:hypothetical protein
MAQVEIRKKYLAALVTLQQEIAELDGEPTIAEIIDHLGFTESVIAPVITLRHAMTTFALRENESMSVLLMALIAAYRVGWADGRDGQ